MNPRHSADNFDFCSDQIFSDEVITTPENRGENEIIRELICHQKRFEHITYENLRRFSALDFIYCCRGVYEAEESGNTINHIGMAGDFIVCVPHSDTMCSILVGDVCGHDLKAAQYSIQIQELLNSREFAEQTKDKPLSEIIDFIQEQTPLGTGREFALTWIRIDTLTMGLEILTAQNPAPVLLEPGFEPRFLRQHSTPVYLGKSFFDVQTTTNATYILNQELLIVMTDGLQDALGAVLRQHDSDLNTFLKGIKQTQLPLVLQDFLDAAPLFSDDMSIVIIKRAKDSNK